jgi:protein-S-isoprenylcysteine O-methyltransferase Ste14
MTPYEMALLGYAALCVATVVPLLFVTAPYGRHARGGWGPAIPEKLGWVVMESPAVLFFAYVFSQGANATQTAPLVLLALWQLHYIRRTFIYPFSIRSKGKTMPVLIAGLAFVYNFFNAYINAHWIGHLGDYPTDWLYGPTFWIGLLVFGAGMTINIHSDAVLRGLRAPGETGYKIPYGGMYRWISAPNYFGELIQWFGWAILTWSLGGLAFAIYTAANLAPRAIAHHRWYQTTFEDYPSERRALIPYLW